MVTTIQLSENVKEKLDKLKIYSRETYNDLIQRIIENIPLNNMNKESLIETIETLCDPETLKDIAEALEQYNHGEAKDFEDIKKELRLCIK